MKSWRGAMEWPAYEPAARPSRAERFWSKVAVKGVSDCWGWAGSRLPNGYGQFDHTTAHRVSLVMSGTQVPDDAVVDHLCRNPPCVNPAHLEVVTQSVNVRRGDLPAQASAAIVARSQARMFCKNGHAMTPDNTYTPPGAPNWRVCRACKAERQRRASTQFQ